MTPSRRVHGRKLSSYDFGRTTVYASRFDPRLSYCAYVPLDYEEDGAARYPLVVVVHGTLRDATSSRDAFAAFAEAHSCIVLAPLFPAGITGPADVSSYKMMVPCPIRYDLALLAMVEEIGSRYRLAGPRFSLFGFSGGGHFAHRFFYLHPQRLQAVSIGAPGIVTLLDRERDYWVGVRDFEAAWGRPIDVDAMRQVAVQTVIGTDDRDTWEITITPSHPAWRPDWDVAGGNRPERLASLKASFERNGIAVRHDAVPGVAHRWDGLLPAVVDFFGEQIPRLAPSSPTPRP